MDTAATLRNAADAAERKAKQAAFVLSADALSEGRRLFLSGQVAAFSTMAADLRWMAAAADADTMTRKLCGAA